MTKSFSEQVYDLVRSVPSGMVTTYGDIARAMGTQDARKVGWALHQNPYEGEVACHRVVNRDGRVAPEFAFGGAGEQRARLEAEGVSFTDELHVDMKKHHFVV